MYVKDFGSLSVLIFHCCDWSTYLSGWFVTARSASPSQSLVISVKQIVSLLLQLETWFYAGKEMCCKALNIKGSYERKVREIIERKFRERKPQAKESCKLVRERERVLLVRERGRAVCVFLWVIQRSGSLLECVDFKRLYSHSWFHRE